MSTDQEGAQDTTTTPFQQLTTSIVASIAQVFNTVVMPAVQTIHDAIQSAYQEAGMPYGDSHEGLMRWMDDMSKINHMRQEIEYIKNYHQMLIDARAMGERIRQERGEQQV
jgi:hypothetical protein